MKNCNPRFGITLLFVSKLSFRWDVDYISDEKGFIFYAFLFYCIVISFSILSSYELRQIKQGDVACA